MKLRRARGVTLIEVLVAIAIAAVLAGFAVPSFVQSMARTRLEGTVSLLATDLQYARSEAIRRGNKVADDSKVAARLALTGGGTGYTITVASAADGATTPVKVVTLPTGVTLTSDGDVTFDGLRGTSNQRTFTATVSGVSGALRVTTNALGRISTCSSSIAFVGHTPC